MDQNEFYAALFRQTALAAEIAVIERIRFSMHSLLVEKQTELDAIKQKTDAYTKKDTDL